MARSKSGRSSDESSGSDDPDQSRSTPNYRQRSDDPNAADADSAFDGTQQKQFDEQDGQSDDSVAVCASHASSAIQALAPSLSQSS